MVGAGYVALTLSYTLVWRHILLLDLIAISGGFVLRAVAGGVAPPVALSRWFLLVISAAAVCVAAGKRHAELRRSQSENSARRRVLDSYTRRLRFVVAASAGVAAVRVLDVGSSASRTWTVCPWRPLTILPFAACLLRYGALVRAGAGEAPEELILKRPGASGRRPGAGWCCSRSVSMPPADQALAVGQRDAGPVGQGRRCCAAGAGARASPRSFCDRARRRRSQAALELARARAAARVVCPA